MNEEIILVINDGDPKMLFGNLEQLRSGSLVERN